MPISGQNRGLALEDFPKAGAGLLDMLAAALRGGTKATLGLPGDIESLFRDKPVLPTTEDWDKRLPPLNPLIPYPGAHPYEKVGEVVGLPGVGIGAWNTAKALRGTMKNAISSEVANEGRRVAMGNLGKGAVIAGAASIAPTAVIKALRSAEVAPVIAKGSTALRTLAALKASVMAKNAAFHKFDDLGNAEIWGDARKMFQPDELINEGRAYFPSKSDQEILEIYERMLDMDKATNAQQGTKTLADIDIPKGVEFENEVMKQVISGKIKPKEFKPGTFDDFDYGNTDYFDARQPLWGYIE